MKARGKLLMHICRGCHGGDTCGACCASENPFGDVGRYRVCSTLGEYIFVGGTAGFDTLSHGDLFGDGCALPGIEAVGIVSA